MEQKVLRMSAGVLVLALVIRLMGSPLPGQVAEFLSSPGVSSFLMFLETGYTIRPVRVSFSEPAEEESRPEQTAPAVTEPELQPVIFSQEDAQLVELVGAVSCPVGLEELVAAPLEWDLYADGPQVLIVHSHGSESYENTEGYLESTDYRTLDTDYNMVSVGALVADRLAAAGIGVIHDTTLHDQPSYNNAYVSSRQAVQKYLEQYSGIRLVLDLHRDAYEDSAGNQVGAAAEDGSAAKLMLVVGTDQGGLDHPNWLENLALGVKLQLQLQQLCPGICRPVNLRTQRFNQDLSTGALLVEVGSAGNTRQQALRAAEVLAEAIVALASGANYEKENRPQSDRRSLHN